MIYKVIFTTHAINRFQERHIQLAKKLGFYFKKNDEYCDLEIQKNTFILNELFKRSKLLKTVYNNQAFLIQKCEEYNISDINNLMFFVNGNIIFAVEKSKKHYFVKSILPHQSFISRFYKPENINLNNIKLTAYALNIDKNIEEKISKQTNENDKKIFKYFLNHNNEIIDSLENNSDIIVNFEEIYLKLKNIGIILEGNNKSKSFLIRFSDYYSGNKTFMKNKLIIDIHTLKTIEDIIDKPYISYSKLEHIFSSLI